MDRTDLTGEASVSRRNVRSQKSLHEKERIVTEGTAIAHESAADPFITDVATALFEPELPP
jgi:hypothetical protein